MVVRDVGISRKYDGSSNMVISEFFDGGIPSTTNNAIKLDDSC